MEWKIARRTLDLSRPLVIGILNVTPDSFSDGGKFLALEDALRQAEKLIRDGADILDIGGESTRPGSRSIEPKEEMARVIPVIEAIVKQFDTPISIDTTRSEVAEAAVNAGAEIINDISGLRFDERIADAAAKHRTGLVLMHSCGHFETMHSQTPVTDILSEVAADLRRSTRTAIEKGVGERQIVLDVGIGFGKTQEQNLELIARLDKLISEFAGLPMLIGTSRKSFIGKLLGDVPPDERLVGSLVTASIAVWNGAKIVRVHDVKETVEALKTLQAVESMAS